MWNKFVSYFNGPIKKVEGNYPTDIWSLEQVYRYVTSDEDFEATTIMLRNIRARDEKAYKNEKGYICHFITPAGLFRYRDIDGLYWCTGSLVVDIDGLPTRDMARQLRDTLFYDKSLQSELAYVSPSDFGVKLILPFEQKAQIALNDCYKEAVHSVWDYLVIKYGIEKYIDKKNVDIARACFLCHDADAKYREDNIINILKPYKK